jgi:SAM-dependent methyltransferase
MAAMSSHQEANRAAWTTFAADYVAPAERNWAAEEITWGIFDVPESEVGLLPELDDVELGCGTAYVCAWLARRGARPTGVDLTAAQLDTARRLQREHGLEFPLVEADAEDVPLPDGCADVVISEYGAVLWCRPERWVAEAARLLRPGGRLAFVTSSTLRALCDPVEGQASERLVRDYDAIRRLEWADDGSIEFHLPHGDWIELLRGHGFEIELLREIRVPEDATTRYEHVDARWASRWPVEDAWRAVLRR